LQLYFSADFLTECFLLEEKETLSVPNAGKNIPALQPIRGHRYVITCPAGIYINLEVVVNEV
jgi:hypothetical protein